LNNATARFACAAAQSGFNRTTFLNSVAAPDKSFWSPSNSPNSKWASEIRRKANGLAVSENSIRRAVQPRERPRAVRMAASVRWLQRQGLTVVLRRHFGLSLEEMDFP